MAPKHLDLLRSLFLCEQHKHTRRFMRMIANGNSEIVEQTHTHTLILIRNMHRKLSSYLPFGLFWSGLWNKSKDFPPPWSGCVRRFVQFVRLACERSETKTDEIRIMMMLEQVKFEPSARQTVRHWINEQIVFLVFLILIASMMIMPNNWWCRSPDNFEPNFWLSDFSAKWWDLSSFLL